MAGSWTTCAVGEAHRTYPLIVCYSHCLNLHENDAFSCGTPGDGQLERMGDHFSGFAWAVGTQRIDAAEALLDQIEDRVLELKRTHV